MLNNQKNANNSYSVLMTVYAKENPEHFEQAIRSMLFQTVKPNDFVIVCDGPLTEALDAIISHYVQLEPELFQIIRCQCNGGSGTASRIGLAQCRNELVARMDSDDISVENRMEILLEAMEAEPELAAVGGQMAEFIQGPESVVGYRILPTEPEKLWDYARTRSPMNNITVMLRKSAALDVGSYSDLRTREDYELWIRMLAKGYRLRNLDRVLAYARVGKDMYNRRRGLEYSKNAVYTEKLLLECGFISRPEYYLNLSARFTMSVIIPRKLGHWIFRTFLRQRGVAAVTGEQAGTISPEVFNGPFRKSAEA